jgi:hypothetical protein
MGVDPPVVPEGLDDARRSGRHATAVGSRGRVARISSGSLMDLVAVLDARDNSRGVSPLTHSAAEKTCPAPGGAKHPKTCVVDAVQRLGSGPSRGRHSPSSAERRWSEDAFGGGGGRESNPPASFHPPTDFEDRNVVPTVGQRWERPAEVLRRNRRDLEGRRAIADRPVHKPRPDQASTSSDRTNTSSGDSKVRAR